MAEPLGKGPRGTVLVTGATGFIASHTLLALAKAGYTVRGTARSAEKAAALNATLSNYAGEPVEIELFSADLGKDEGWAEAAAGCGYVVHMASPFPAGVPKDPNDLIRPAREGALRVLKAAKKAGAKRVVMTSSFAAIGYGHGANKPDVFTEEHWSNADNLNDNSAYARSKTLAEKAAWEFIAGDGHGMELAVINPVAVLGPAMSTDTSTSLELVTQPLQRKIPAVPKMAIGIVDARDVADAHVLAMENPQAAGQRYITCVDVMWMQDMAKVLAEAYPDRKIPTGQLPNWLVRLVSNFNPALKTILPELGNFRQTNSDKIRQELGWKPRSAKEAILSAADSVIKLGMA